MQTDVFFLADTTQKLDNIYKQYVLHILAFLPFSLSQKFSYHKVPKISPWAYIFQRPFLRAYIWRVLYTEGNLRFKIDWASHIVGRKFTVCALFYFVKLRAISKYRPPGGLYLEGQFKGGVYCVTSLGDLYLEGLICGILW